MPSIDIRTRLDTSRLDEIVRALPERTKQATAAAAQAIVEDIQDHWSGDYPPASTNGASPAVRSGNLDSSIQAEPIGDGFTYMIGPNLQQAPYAVFLEEGWRTSGGYHKHPFLAPASRRMTRRFRRYYFDLFK